MFSKLKDWLQIVLLVEWILLVVFGGYVLVILVPLIGSVAFDDFIITIAALYLISLLNVIWCSVLCYGLLPSWSAGHKTTREK